MATLLDGNAVSAEIRAEIKAEIDKRRRRHEARIAEGHGAVRRPDMTPYAELYKPLCLAVVLCTDDPASEVYVRRKQEACAEVGITSYLIRPFGDGGPANWMDAEGHLLRTIDYLNADPSVHGVLVQLPLPAGFSNRRVFDRISPLKDVDVFCPENVGLLVQGRPRYVPCTPAGVQELLVRSGVEIAGRKVAIINRSDVVGKPLHALLSADHEWGNATCTLCHDRTPPELLRRITLSSDIVVVAVGRPGFLTADMVSEGAVVVDVGINRVEGSKKIVGDVDFPAVSDKVAAVTPVPGGVGPMTVTMLLRNTVEAQKLQ